MKCLYCADQQTITPHTYEHEFLGLPARRRRVRCPECDKRGWTIELYEADIDALLNQDTDMVNRRIAKIVRGKSSAIVEAILQDTVI